MTDLKVIELLDAASLFERKIGVALMYSALRMPQFKAMLCLEKLGKITVSDLSRHMNVTRATMSVLINELVRSGIVECLENTSDKRSFYVHLTADGSRRLALAKSEVAMVIENLSQHFSEETRQALNEFACSVQHDR